MLPAGRSAAASAYLWQPVPTSNSQHESFSPSGPNTPLQLAVSLGDSRRRMASPPQAPSSQPGTRIFSDVVDQVLRFVQQPASNSKTPKSGSAEDVNTTLDFNANPASTSGRNANYSPMSGLDGERGPWHGIEHEASPLSPSRTLVASSSSNSSSSTPRSRYRPLKRTESAGSTSSSASRRTETQNRGAEEGTRKGTEKVEKGKRLNVSERLRRLGRKMQSQKGRLSSPKVSAGELADDSESERRMRPSSLVYHSAVPSTPRPETGRRTVVQRNGKGKQQRAPGAHAKLLSMVAEADEPSTPSTSTSSSRFSGSEATTPTAVHTPAATHQILAPSAPNHANRPRDAPPEPTTLAARIQAFLITVLPFPSFPRSDTLTEKDLPPSESQPVSTGPPAHTPPPPEFSASVPSDYGIDLSVETDAEGRPIPPPYASPLPPRERMLLEEFLRSPVIMNGELPPEDPDPDARRVAHGGDEVRTQKPGNDKQKPTAKVTRSIWSVLESMGTGMGKAQSPEPSPSAAPASSNTPALQSVPQNAATNENEHESMYSDTGSSVMIYSPLIPSGAQDLPELAEVVPVGAQHLTYEGQACQAGPEATPIAAPTDPNAAEAASSWIPGAVRQWSFVQAISSWSTAVPVSSTDDGASASAIPPSATSITSTAAAVPGNDPPPSRSAAVRKAWVPSTTKMSVQAMWWGYRLYLPPPVMAVLSDRTLEASKRAALITAALTWFFANLPIAALPPPLQPAALLLQRIAPFLGYIGAFISWSWGVIEGYDVGYGVTLTATWLLPMALIPGTWHKDEFPTSPSALGQPVPLPQILYSPVPASHRALDPVGMVQTPAGPVPARVTEFLPLPIPTTTSSPLTTSKPTPDTIPTPLPSSPAVLQSSISNIPPAAGQPSPHMTPTPTPPTPISPSRTPRLRREVELEPSTPQTNIGSAMSSPTQTPSSHYQTPLLSSPAPTSSSLYQTPLSSPYAPLSPRLPSSAYPTSLTYRATPGPASIPSTPATPTSPLQKQTHPSIHSPAPSTPAPSPPSPTHTSRTQPQSLSKSKSASTHASVSTPVAATPVDVPPIPPAPVQASVKSPNPRRTFKATAPSRSQSHSETQSSSHSPPAVPSPMHTQTTYSNTRTAPPATRTHSHYNPASVPVGSPLEQHLLSGPLMSPIALPDVDLPVSPPSLPTQALTSTTPVPVPDSASREEERKRERDRDKARIRERARAIFRRTNSSGATGSQKAKA